MPRLDFPKPIARARKVRASRSCPAHRAWVRRHYCCVPECERLPIECAHVRKGTDGGIGRKPSDRWAISLCWFHHREQHNIGEAAFEATHELDLRALANEFAKISPYRNRLG